MNILRDISVDTGISPSDLRRIIADAPARYKQYEIDKRSGGKRIIAQPSRELKVLQHYLLHHTLSKLPIHSAAMAYVHNRNIKENAEAHRRNSAILKLDFADFFPSVCVEDWIHYVRKYKPDWETSGDLPAIIKILFWGQKTPFPKCLSIGAPTSPLVSNLVMYDLDTLFANEADRIGVSYTRYADDITLSGISLKKVLQLEAFIRETLKACPSPKLRINEGKRGVYTKGQRRMVTGLVVTPEARISIGRERRRAISALIHKFSLNALTMKEIGYLKGMLGFAIANEVVFVERMRRKYGSELIDRILSLHIPRRSEMEIDDL